MPYTPFNRDQTEFKSGINILASQDFRYTVEGGTIDAAAVGNRYVPVGFPLVQDVATRRYVPWDDTTTAGDGYRDPVLCNVDFYCDGTNNVVVGELIQKGYVYSAKLPDEVTDAFKAANTNIFYEDRGL